MVVMEETGVIGKTLPSMWEMECPSLMRRMKTGTGVRRKVTTLARNFKKPLQPLKCHQK